MRLVDADALLAEINTFMSPQDMTTTLAVGMACRWIENAPTIEPEKAIKDCRNCKFGKYNDRYGIRFCYKSDDCVDWNLWEPKEEPERKKGRWIKKYKGEINSWCSVCGKEVGRQTNYCPRCGSDLRGDGNGSD